MTECCCAEKNARATKNKRRRAHAARLAGERRGTCLVHRLNPATVLSHASLANGAFSCKPRSMSWRRFSPTTGPRVGSRQKESLRCRSCGWDRNRLGRIRRREGVAGRVSLRKGPESLHDAFLSVLRTRPRHGRLASLAFDGLRRFAPDVAVGGDHPHGEARQRRESRRRSRLERPLRASASRSRV